MGSYWLQLITARINLADPRSREDVTSGTHLIDVPDLPQYRSRQALRKCAIKYTTARDVDIGKTKSQHTRSQELASAAKDWR